MNKPEVGQPVYANFRNNGIGEDPGWMWAQLNANGVWVSPIDGETIGGDDSHVSEWQETEIEE